MPGRGRLRLRRCGREPPGPGLGCSDRVGQGVNVVDAVVAASVDEEGRRAGDATLVGARDIADSGPG